MKILAKCIICKKIKPVWNTVDSEKYCKDCSEPNKSTNRFCFDKKVKNKRKTIKWKLGNK